MDLYGCETCGKKTNSTFNGDCEGCHATKKHPKSLRDEFAMVSFVALFREPRWTDAGFKTIWDDAYEAADIALEARKPKEPTK